MKRAEWDALATRIAWVRHRTWCLASENPETGQRSGDCTSARIIVDCAGPKHTDLSLANRIATELWGKRPGEENVESQEQEEAPDGDGK